MPIIDKLTIFSCTSEDSAYPAANLLRQTGKKWIGKSANESSVSVIFQLPKPMQISGIDIGNENAAFIEVLVAPTIDATNADYQQILLPSSLMSIIECRNESNPNRVRCFGKQSLVKDVVDRNWQMIKIVCTQPYNKSVKYGLSFVKIHTPPAPNSNDEMASEKATEVAKPNLSFGKFRLRQDSSDSERDTSGSLFSRWKQSRQNASTEKPKLSAAAAIRDSSSPSMAIKKVASASAKTTPKLSAKRSRNTKPLSSDDEAASAADKQINRNRTALLYDDEDDRPIEKFDKKIERERQDERKKREAADKKSTKNTGTANFQDFLSDETETKSQKSSSQKESKRNRSKERTPSKKFAKTSSTASKYSPVASVSNDSGNRKRHSSPDGRQRPTPSDDGATTTKKARFEKVAEAKPRTYRPFHRLLTDVVLVISGIPNPLRSELRQKALDLGAKYKPDWDDSCTHLICAFKNTPKYNQVCGRGKIVAKTWIGKCYSSKKRIPWRRHALDSDEESKSDSEDEIFDETLRPPETATISIDDSPVKERTISPRPSTSQQSVKSRQSHRSESSEIDTEDELDRIRSKQKLASANANTNVAKLSHSSHTDDIYGKTTEEDERQTKRTDQTDDDNNHTQSISPLPEFFENKTFYLCDNISSIDDIKLRRFISVYKGELIETASLADYIITTTLLPGSGDRMKGEIVKPLWVFECNDMECLLPTKRYKF